MKTFVLVMILIGPVFIIFAALAAFAIKKTQKKGYATKHMIDVMHHTRSTGIRSVL